MVPKGKLTLLNYVVGLRKENFALLCLEKGLFIIIISLVWSVDKTEYRTKEMSA